MRIEILGAILALTVGSAHAEDVAHLYASQSGAKKHCPGDTLVWVNLASKIYHLPGTVNYGTTHNGKYACMGEVAKDPEFKASKNGQ